jgi:hypothetical protein
MKMSILSARTAQADQTIKLGGKIRPGIKVLTKVARDNPIASEIYNEGVSRRLKYSDIEKRIRERTNIENPMFPRNTAFFNVAASDFGMPEIAEKIIEMFGEVREEHSNEKQLYRFPVVFHSDELEEVYPNQLKRYGGEQAYESHYGDDGERYCRYLPEVSAEQLAEQKARRQKRAPRREHVLRGKCDPGICNEFLQGQCRFRGRLHFYIPGISSTGLLGMETTSEYAAETIWANLDRIRRSFGGIPRSNPNKPGSNIFYITKVLEQRSYFDELGKKQTGFQWVPTLQADIDIGSILIKGMAPQLAMTTTPVAWISAPRGMPLAAVLPASDVGNGTDLAAPRNTGPVQLDPKLDGYHQLSQVVEMMGLNEDDVAQYLDLKLGLDWIDNAGKISAGAKLLSDLSRVGNVCASHLIQLSNQVHANGIPHHDFLEYAARKFGKGFTTKAECLLDIRSHLGDLEDAGPGQQLQKFDDL